MYSNSSNKCLPPMDIRDLSVDKPVVLVILMSPASSGLLISDLPERLHLSSGTQVLLYF